MQYKVLAKIAHDQVVPNANRIRVLGYEEESGNGGIISLGIL